MNKNPLKITKKAASEDTLRSKPKAQNIKVLIRVRPQLKSEFGKEKAVTISHDNKSVTLNTRANTITSTLDGAFNEETTQLEVFQQINHTIPQVLQGYNSTIFAYGQTGSGKTHTMFGSDWENVIFKNNGIVNIQNTYIEDLENDVNFSGLIPRSIHKLFKEINAPQHAHSGFAVYCSFLQIYNEKIYDLLTDKSGTTSLNIRENKIDGIYVEGLTEYCVPNFQECLKIMQQGERNRFTRQTSANVKSSRSHTIFQLIVESTKADATGKIQKAKFNLCDLAGSEKLNKSEDIQGAHLLELKNINLSLTTLGKVIQNLSVNKKMPVPYRESKLTRLLQDSLGGNTKTCLIATLSPILEHVDESINTIKFAERANHITTEVKANKIEAMDAELIQKLQKEIKYLKEILNIRRKGTSAINQVHNKLLILQEENDRLRNAHLSVNEVEKLMDENKMMRLELQQMKIDYSPQKLFDSADKNSEVKSITNTEYNNSKGFMTPRGRSAADKNQDILDQMHSADKAEQVRQSLLSASQSTKSTRSFDPTSKNLMTSFDRINSPNSNAFSSLTVSTQKSQYNPINIIPEGNFVATLDLPKRVKGNTRALQERLEAQNAKPSAAIQKAEQRKKEQERALRRLADLEVWQKNMKEREVNTFMGSPMRSKDMEISSKKDSTANSTQTDKMFEKMEKPAEKPAEKSYKNADFDKMYNPYKVRQEIERKYNPHAKGANNVASTKNSEYNSKLRNIEKNFF